MKYLVTYTDYITPDYNAHNSFILDGEPDPKLINDYIEFQHSWNGECSQAFWTPLAAEEYAVLSNHNRTITSDEMQAALQAIGWDSEA